MESPPNPKNLKQAISSGYLRKHTENTSRLITLKQASKMCIRACEFDVFALRTTRFAYRASLATQIIRMIHGECLTLL